MIQSQKASLIYKWFVECQTGKAPQEAPEVPQRWRSQLQLSYMEAIVENKADCAPELVGRADYFI